MCGRCERKSVKSKSWKRKKLVEEEARENSSSTTNTRGLIGVPRHPHLPSRPLLRIARGKERPESRTGAGAIRPQDQDEQTPNRQPCHALHVPITALKPPTCSDLPLSRRRFSFGVAAPLCRLPYRGGRRSRDPQSCATSATWRENVEGRSRLGICITMQAGGEVDADALAAGATPR